MTQQGPTDPKAFIRFMLMLSSGVMVIFAVLTLARILPLPPVAGWLFLAVAAVDLTIGYVVFKS